MSTPIPDVVRYVVPPPAAAPRPFGLFSVAAEGAGSPAPVDDPGVWERGVDYWSPNCSLNTGSLDDWCPAVDPEKELTPYAPVKVSGPMFVVHSGSVCVAPNFDGEAEARAQLERGEQYRAEQVFWDQQVAREDFVDVLGPGVTALSEACGIGLLEAYAAEHYGARPVLHIPVSLVPLLMSQYILAEPEGGRLVTRWGTPVVAGAGYPQQNRILITGTVTMWRTEIYSNARFEPRSNENIGLAERTFVITADCLAAAVTVPGCLGGA